MGLARAVSTPGSPRSPGARSWLAAIVIAVVVGLPSVAPAAEDPVADAAALRRQADELYRQGRYSEIEPVLKRSIDILEKQLGPEDPKLAEGLGSLADLYAIEGRYSEAETIYKRVLAIRERVPGPNRLDLGASLNGLAGLYKLEGRYSEAEQLFRRTWRSSRMHRLGRMTPSSRSSIISR